MKSTLDCNRSFTYADYLEWPEDERWELIEGQAFDMTPAPSPQHQQMLVELARQIANFLVGRACVVYVAPFDVRLPEGDEDDLRIKTVVQPDIAVICNRSKIDARGSRGAPDFVVEIISPSSASKDQITKTALYEKKGVKEYWIIRPSDNTLIIRLLGENGQYGPPITREGRGYQEVATLPGLAVDLDAVFRASI
ncbi:MAG: Uma2 family endonuclease [Deltaproteobacteria bacterium]|nr:Uma2 family endonuclease [Deltaproteobacteria bacterium]